jgi:segregation and condensation protein A
MDIDDLIEKSFWRDILYEIISTMDPWDINLTELATRYSEKVEAMKEMNFKVPANVVLVSSVLLRMKADIVAAVEFNPLEFAPEDTEGLNFNELDIGSYSEIGAIDGAVVEGDDEIPISVTPKRVTKRRVTATELIAAIQEVLEDRKVKNCLEKEGHRIQAIEIALSIDIRKLIEDTYRKVVSILSMNSDHIARFSEMAPERKDIVPTFMSLLHLSNDQRVSLRQERIYEEIFISIR